MVVIGGGFYGCMLALHQRRSRGATVLLVERDSALLGRASYVNQARVHNGYHYPRSFLTALRSRVNYPRFLADFRDCIDDGFAHWYAIGKRFSHVSARQFQTFCERIQAPLEPAPPEARRHFDADFVEDVFVVRECAFDAVRLRARLARDLADAGVEVLLGTEASRVRGGEAGGVDVVLESAGTSRVVSAERVLNCTYARTNRLLADSGLPRIALKHELTEMAVIEPPPELRATAITVMCGPFFSMMPFPPLGRHTLSHVRYTPHVAWSDDPDAAYSDPYERLAAQGRRTAFPHMIRDAARYVPALARCRHDASLWEVKTVLPRSETDDGRPILFKPTEGLPGLVNVMGSKIDNVYDAVQQLEAAVGELAGGRS